MRSWLGKTIVCLSVALLTLLLLSALVEGPQEAVAESPAAPPLTGVVFLPCDVPVPLQNQQAAPQLQPNRVEAAAVERDSLSLCALIPVGCDANGQVVRTPRYVDSAYLLFRQEAASG